jgi:hypothetical protein
MEKEPEEKTNTYDYPVHTYLSILIFVSIVQLVVLVAILARIS